jgi:uncharacterized membrane protein
LKPLKRTRNVAARAATDEQLPVESATNEALTKLDDLIPPEKRAKAAVIIREVISEVSQHSGPLPQHTDMAAYEAICPGFAERIMRMAEKEQDDRHHSMKDWVGKEYALKSRGQNYALICVPMFLAFAGYLAYLGDTKASAWVIGAGLVSIVGIYVTGRLKPNREETRDSNGVTDE